MTYETIVAGTKSSIGKSSSGATFSHTVPSGGNRILIVAVGAFETGSATYATAVTYGGSALTQAVSNGNVERHYSLWYKLNPTAGTANVQVTIAGGDWCGGAISFTGAKQEAPSVATSSGHSTTITCSIACSAGSAAVSACITADRSGAPTSNNTSLYSAAWKDTWYYGCAGGYATNKSGTATLTFTTPDASYNVGILEITPNPVIQISTSQNISVSTTSNIVPDARINVHENVSVSTNVTPILDSFIPASDSVTITDITDQNIRNGWSIHIWKEHVSVEDEPQMPGEKGLGNQFEDVHVTDNVYIKLSDEGDESYKPYFKVGE